MAIQIVSFFICFNILQSLQGSGETGHVLRQQDSQQASLVAPYLKLSMLASVWPPPS